MLDRIFGENTHRYIQLIALCALVIGLPTSKAIMSMSLLLLLLNILLEAQWKRYWDNIKQNKVLLLISAFLLYNLTSLLWSSNIDYGLHDVKVKLPLIVLPLILTCRPINLKDFKIVLSFFVATLVFTSLVNFASYNNIIGSRSYDDIRGLSLFSSHVRYGLLVTAGISGSIYLFQNSNSRFRYLLLVVIIWLVSYTLYSQVLSGIITLFGIGAIYLILYSWQKNIWFSLGTSLVILVSVIIGAVYILKADSYNPKDYSNLDKFTINGNPYSHRLAEISPETGDPINIYICRTELKDEWEKVSSLGFESKTPKGEPMDITLIRYMASMGLRKDSLGFQSLTKEDIKNIEKGCASIYCTGLPARIYSLKYQLNNNKDPNGHSLLQRLEYWKTGTIIAQNNILFGTGTGDVQDAFDLEYIKQNSALNLENRKRAHNMYLTVLLSIGIIGLFFFLWFHIEFIIYNLRLGNMLGVALISILLISYLFEDTLETQTGVFFAALIFALFTVPQFVKNK